MPEDDPGDVGAALARLTELTIGLQRQITRAESVFTEQIKATIELIRESEARATNLTDAKFVTYRTLIDSQAEKVALALQATEKAIDKAEVATSKAIDKAEIATADRFASVNEFRGQLNDQVATFVPRGEAGVQRDALQEQIRRLDEQLKTTQIWQGNITGRIAAIGVAFTVVMTIIIFAANFITRK